MLADLVESYFLLKIMWIYHLKNSLKLVALQRY